MSIELHNWGDLPVGQQTAVAEQVAGYTQGKLGEVPQMLPVTVTQIFAKYAGSVALVDESFGGYIAALEPERYADLELSEVGSLMVPRLHRKQGIAHLLIRHLSEGLQQVGVTPYAFCNPLSIQIFQDNGYVPASHGQIPPQAFAACVSCPMQPEVGCCDTPVIYQGAMA